MTELTCFCPQCQRFINPTQKECLTCGWQRPAAEQVTPAGKERWHARLDGPVRGRAVTWEDLVIFAWGSREGGGGVAAFDAWRGEERWKFRTQYAVEAGAALAGGRVVFATLGFMGQGAELYCLEAAGGAPAWERPIPLSAGVLSPPLVVENLFVFAATEDGLVHGFRLADGSILPSWPAQLSRGRNGLVEDRDRLVVACEAGQVVALNLKNGRPLWELPLDPAGRITSLPGRDQSAIYLGVEGGRVISVGLHSRQVSELGSGWKKVAAAPCPAGDVLYVGAWDHCLHALDLKKNAPLWRREFAHSISSSPATAEGLVYFGGNDGMVHALDAASGQTAWEFPLPDHRPALASPACRAGLVYTGCESGDIYALPWHLGNFRLAAEKRAEGLHQEQAAGYFAIQCCLETRSIQARQQSQQLAIQTWQEVGRWDLAAYFQASFFDEQPQKIAELFENAGRMLSHTNPAAATSLLRQASEIYAEADLVEKAHFCEQVAAKTLSAPYLTLHAVNLPPQWEAGEQHNVVLEIKNRGSSPARNVWVRLAGSLARRVWMEFPPMRPGASVEIDMPLVAAAPGEGHLQAEVRYADAQDTPWSAQKRFPMSIQPSSTFLTLEGNAGAVMLEDYDRQLRGRIKIKGDVGLLKLGSGEGQAPGGPETAGPEQERSGVCPHCEQEYHTTGRLCDRCGRPLDQPAA
jgi:outer membrane protein assembly factor BamB